MPVKWLEMLCCCWSPHQSNLWSLCVLPILPFLISKFPSWHWFFFLFSLPSESLFCSTVATQNGSAVWAESLGNCSLRQRERRRRWNHCKVADWETSVSRFLLASHRIEREFHLSIFRNEKARSGKITVSGQNWKVIKLEMCCSLCNTGNENMCRSSSNTHTHTHLDLAFITPAHFAFTTAEQMFHT